MTVRGFVIGALSVASCFAIFAATTEASAEMRKKGGGVGICISVPPPVCNLFLHAVCVKKSRCGGCLAWKCQPWTPKK